MKFTSTALLLLSPLLVLAQDQTTTLPNPAINTGPALSQQSSLVSSVYSASSVASTISQSAASSASSILASASSSVGGSATDASASSVLSSASSRASSVLSSASSTVSQISSSVLSAASSSSGLAAAQHPMATAGAMVGAAAMGFAILL